jgi:hypothetical protein
MVRVDIVGVEATAPWSEVLDRVGSSTRAFGLRRPLDNVIGILAKDCSATIIDSGRRGWLRLVRGLYSSDKDHRCPAPRLQGRPRIAYRRRRVRWPADFTIEDVLGSSVKFTDDTTSRGGRRA